jgi:hypothetical protein
MGKISQEEWDGIKQTAELLSHAAKSAFPALNR